MAHELARLRARCRKVESEHYVVEPALEKDDQVVTRLTRESKRLFEGVVELSLHKSIISLERLLFAKLHCVL